VADRPEHPGLRRPRLAVTVRQALESRAPPGRASPGKRQGPRMYEMQGPCPASRHRSAGCPATLRLSDLPLVAGTRRKLRFPGSSRASGVAPGPIPSPAVTYFYCPGSGLRKGHRAAISRFFSRPQAIHRNCRVVLRSRHLFTALSTTLPTGCRPDTAVPPRRRTPFNGPATGHLAGQPRAAQCGQLLPVPNDVVRKGNV
jgi:hypothetical protein